MEKVSEIEISLDKDSNIIIGQTHFIKTVEDLYEALITSFPNIEFGIAFNEAYNGHALGLKKSFYIHIILCWP